MRVFVYYNLHKKLFSIKALEGPNKGRVIAHAPAVVLDNVTFKVSEAGRQRVLREQRKNVHAGLVGEFTEQEFRIIKAGIDLTQKVTYDPYKYNSFVDANTLEPITSATSALLIDKRIYI